MDTEKVLLPVVEILKSTVLSRSLSLKVPSCFCGLPPAQTFPGARVGCPFPGEASLQPPRRWPVPRTPRAGTLPIWASATPALVELPLAIGGSSVPMEAWGRQVLFCKPILFSPAFV